MEQSRMRTTSSQLFIHIRGCLCLAALILALIFGLAELGSTNPTFAKAGYNSNSKSLLTAGSFTTYQWNLSDQTLPLLSLPDHVEGSVDLALTYSMSQFQFPLFQSLYYNAQASRYIVMVLANQGRRTEFIQLNPGARHGQFEASDDSGLRLSEKGSLRFLNTREGTVYTFAAFADGELHCSRIRNRDGKVINLKYTNSATIETISDATGRTVDFSYTDDYVSAITQTWNPSSMKLRKTWAIDTNPARSAKTPFQRVPAIAATSKRIPTNAINSAHTEEMSLVVRKLAIVFGGSGAVAAANGFEPIGLGKQYPLYRGDLIGDDARIRRGHLSYAIHIYGSEDGTADSPLYVPSGFISHSPKPTPTDAAVTFYYPRLGNLTDVTLAVFHVANFNLSHESGRVRIGNIGGPGGSATTYKHSHVEFYRGNCGLPSVEARLRLRIDPSSVFESITNAENLAIR